MNIGDKVRTKHGSEEGIVVKLLPDNIIEIEIEEGFTIPLVKSDVVIVHQAERNEFAPSERSTTTNTPTRERILATSGFYLSAHRNEKKQITLTLINNSDIEVLYTFATQKNQKYELKSAGKLDEKSHLKIIEMQESTIATWPLFKFQLLPVLKTTDSAPTLLEVATTINFNQTKENSDIPLIGENGFLFQLDGDQKSSPKTDQPKAFNSSVLAEKMMSENEAPKVSKPHKKSVKPSTEVDLHLDAITDQPNSIAEENRLHFQLLKFEQELSGALENNLDGITFIHGVGNGTLRHEIHKRLSQHPFIQYFEDASKEKFGYGATYVKL